MAGFSRVALPCACAAFLAMSWSAAARDKAGASAADAAAHGQRRLRPFFRVSGTRDGAMDTVHLMSRDGVPLEVPSPAALACFVGLPELVVAGGAAMAGAAPDAPRSDVGAMVLARLLEACARGAEPSDAVASDGAPRCRSEVLFVKTELWRELSPSVRDMGILPL